MSKKVTVIKLDLSKSFKILSFMLSILLILGDVLFFQQTSDFRTFPILFFYIFCILILKIHSSTTFFLCLILFILIYIQYAFANPLIFESQYPINPFGERMVVWLYIFLAVGIFQKYFE